MNADPARWGDLGNHWYAAARSDAVGRGAPVAATVLGVRVALWRTRSGAVAAVHDRCLHRNARLSAGVVVDGHLGCPYHGWTYDGAGRLVGVPSEPPGACPPALGLPRYPVCEQDGLVWVWVGARSPDDLPERRPFPMPHWGEPGWGAYYMTTRFANGVTDLVENFMDVPHTVYVHRGWFRSPTRERVPTRVERTRDSVLVTYERPDDTIGFTTLLMNPRRLPLVHTDRFYLPSHTRVDYVWGDEVRAFVITSTCTPVDEDTTVVQTLISYKLGAALNTLAPLWLPAYTRRVIGQDVDIMQNQGDSLRYHGQRPPPFHGTAADTIHVHIEALRAWAEHGAAAGEPAPEPLVTTIAMWV